MKKIAVVVVFIFMLATAALAKEEPLTEYQKVVDVPNTSLQIQFDNALKWAAENIRDARFAIEHSDKENGWILINVYQTMKGVGLVPLSIEYTLRLEFKDDRFRGTFTNIHPKMDQTGTVQIESKKAKAKVIEQLDESLFSLRDYILNTGNEDW